MTVISAPKQNMITYSVSLNGDDDNQRKSSALSLKAFIESDLEDQASVLRTSRNCRYLSVTSTEAAKKIIEQRPEVKMTEVSPAPILFGGSRQPAPRP